MTKTIVAVPIFNGAVSPRLDCATKILIAHLQNAEIKDKQELDLRAVQPYQLIGVLMENGVTTVICYHLCKRDWYTLQANGIEVLAGVSGQVDQALKAFAEGKVTPTLAKPFWRHGQERLCKGFRRGRRRHRGQAGKEIKKLTLYKKSEEKGD